MAFRSFRSGRGLAVPRPLPLLAALGSCLPRLLAALACTLLVAPAGCSRPADEVVARIDDEPITLGQLEQSLLAEQGAGFFSDVFLARWLVERDAQRAGITVERQEVADAAIRSEQEALLADFQSSKELLEESLASRGMSLSGWRDSLRHRARHRLLTEKLWRERLSNDETELRRRFTARYGEDGVRRKVRLISVGFDPARSRFYPKSEYEAEAAALPAWLKSEAERLRTRALAGEDFAELARQSSDAMDARTGGDLGFAWHGRLAPELEQAIEITASGAITPPVETPDGVELVQVYDARPAPNGKLNKQVRRLLLARSYPAVKKRKLAGTIRELAAARAKELLARLTAGEDFAELARRFSEDRVSAAAGGEVAAEKYLTLPDEVRHATASAGPGEPPVLVETGSGLTLLQVLEEQRTLYEAVRPTLRQQILEEHPSGKELERFVQQLIKESRVERLAPWMK